MGFSNIVAWTIILTTAATLHAHGQLEIQTAEQAAKALEPLAGRRRSRCSRSASSERACSRFC